MTMTNDHRGLPVPGERGRGGADRMSLAGVAALRGRPGTVSLNSAPAKAIGSREQAKAPRQDRGLADPADRGRASLSLSPCHRDEAVSHCSARNGDRAGERRNVSLLVARAFSSEGYRGILGISKGPWEDTSGGSALLIICPGRAGSAVPGGPNHWRNHGRAWFNSTAILRHVP